MSQAAKQIGPKQRIIETALNLFYEQGYLATGINQIIEEAGVSKASFYDHFKSKDDLCVAYLQERGKVWGGWLMAKINEYDTPYDRFLAPLAFFDKWLPECNFRGCAFLNIASEITDADCQIRKQAKEGKDGFKALLLQLTQELIDSDKDYEHLDAEVIANAYYILTEGVIKTCQIYNDTWPIRTARDSIKNFIWKQT